MSFQSKLRAFLIFLVLLAECVDAVPMPVLRRSHLKRPLVQKELKEWTSFLNEAGFEVSESDLQEHALELGKKAIKVRKTMMAPIRPVSSLTGIGQAWGLFAFPESTAGRLIVEINENGEWKTVHRSPQNGSLLDSRVRYRRIRGTYDDGGDRPKPMVVYSRFVDWLSWNIFLENPDVTSVRVRLDHTHITTPDENKKGEDKRRHVRVRHRKELKEKLMKRWGK